MDSFELKYSCLNSKCENYKKTTDWIHADNLTPATDRYLAIRGTADSPVWVEFHRFHVKESICSCCNHQMKSVEERLANSIKQWDIKHIPSDAKKRPGYYTRYKTTTGGKPEWNPVTDIGGTGSKRNDITG